MQVYKYAGLTKKIIGAAIKVHNYFGLGFKEEIYERSLLIELNKCGLLCKTQLVKDIYYEAKMIGQSRLDILVEGKVLVELKAVTELNKEYYNRVLNYLKIFDIEVGLLINFGCQNLQFKRFVL